LRFNTRSRKPLLARGQLNEESFNRFMRRAWRIRSAKAMESGIADETVEPAWHGLAAQLLS
jgi:hypothetical protein